MLKLNKRAWASEVYAPEEIWPEVELGQFTADELKRYESVQEEEEKREIPSSWIRKLDADAERYNVRRHMLDSICRVIKMLEDTDTERQMLIDFIDDGKYELGYEYVVSEYPEMCA